MPMRLGRLPGKDILCVRYEVLVLGEGRALQLEEECQDLKEFLLKLLLIVLLIAYYYVR